MTAERLSSTCMQACPGARHEQLRLVSSTGLATKPILWRSNAHVTLFILTTRTCTTAPNTK
eukprot:3088075-Amphidinium_carterae.1